MNNDSNLETVASRIYMAGVLRQERMSFGVWFFQTNFKF